MAKIKKLFLYVQASAYRGVFAEEIEEERFDRIRKRVDMTTSTTTLPQTDVRIVFSLQISRKEAREVMAGYLNDLIANGDVL